ncbi:wall-associated kinase family protein [Artemisia annua]|uniref:Wall-associated kinase family protein n=1 Tax=Artemisia annua TaxID=35608 RepID=A0A2U1LJ45_ARTAN|nr:wall-associated kinase family protein [Artemisia annua]
MTGNTQPPKQPIDKAYSIASIKACIPSPLGLDKLNYNSWSNLFTRFCKTYDVHHHLQAPASTSTAPPDPLHETNDSLPRPLSPPRVPSGFRTGTRVAPGRHWYARDVSQVRASQLVCATPKYTKRGCKDTCGNNVTIPFPFGIGAKCSVNEWYTIDCNSLKPYLSPLNHLEVLRVDLENQTVTVNMQKFSDCSQASKSVDLGSSPFLYSKSHNKFVYEGYCGGAFMMDNHGSVLTGCSTTCNNDTNTTVIIDTNKCFGINCCRTTIPRYLKSYRMNLTGLESQLAGDGGCGSAFLLDQDLYDEDNFSRQSFAEEGSNSYVSTALLWTLSDRDKDQLTCCSRYGRMDTWRCSDYGGGGNPYLVDGCGEDDDHVVTKECARCEMRGGYCGDDPIYDVDGAYHGLIGGGDFCNGNDNEIESSRVIINNFGLKVLGEICKEYVEVKENQSKNSKEDDDNKECLVISNDIVRSGDGWLENQIEATKAIGYSLDKLKIDSGYVMCRNKGILKVAWKPLVRSQSSVSVRKDTSNIEILTHGMEFKIRMSDLDEKPLFVHIKDAFKNGACPGHWKLDIWKWPKRTNKRAIFDEILKLRERGAKFDIWKWPKRKKKRVMFDIRKWPKRKKKFVGCLSRLKKECHVASSSVSSFGGSFISSSGQSVVNGVNLLCGAALLSTPYTPGKTYPDMGEAVFGIARRLIISIVLYLLIALDVFPTVWLHDSSILSYISVGGVFLRSSFGDVCHETSDEVKSQTLIVQNSSQTMSIDLGSSPFHFSQSHNKLAIEDCGNAVILEHWSMLTSYTVNFTDLERHVGDRACGSAVLVDQDTYVKGSFSSRYTPLSLLWIVSDHVLRQINCCSMWSSFEVDMSNCTSVSSLICRTPRPVKGNKYLPSGCNVSNLNFFDFVESESVSKTKTPRIIPNDDNIEKETTSVGREGRSELVSKTKTPRIIPNDDNIEKETTSIHCSDSLLPSEDDENPATPLGDNTNSERNVGFNSPENNRFQNILHNQIEEGSVSYRRSSRPSKLPAKLNDCVLNTSTRYGLHKYVNHVVLSSENCCFVSNLNKIVMPENALKEFDGVYGPAWHCIVGLNFGSFVTHSVGGFLYFSMDQKLFVLLFKTNVQRAR